MTSMLFSQPLDKKYTKTPNVFFEEILCAKSTTFNEAKLMGYLIRNTLGFNHKATWIKVSRSQLSRNAQISYGSINPTVQSCIKKGWILEVKQGDKGREERYLFLCTPRNEQIVQGLEKGEIPLANLGSLIDMDIEDLGLQYGLRTQMKNKTNATPATSAENGEDKLSYTNAEPVSSANNEHGSSIDEQVYPQPGQVTYSLDGQGCSGIESAPCTANEEDSYSNSEHVKRPSSQEYQDFEVPLKTITKDNSMKEKNNNNIQQEVVVVQNMIMDLFKKRISRKNVESLILLSEKENVDLNDMIQNTFAYHKQVKPCRNLFGAIHYAIMNGGWDIPDVTGCYAGYYATEVNPLLMQAQETPRRNYTALPIETLRAIYGLRNDECDTSRCHMIEILQN